MNLNGALAFTNAGFTLTAVVCMSKGYVAIRRREIARHRRMMLAAFGASVAFLVSFVFRYVRFGPTHFHGEGAMLRFYQVVWFSHEPLAVLNVLLVLPALLLGLRGSYEAHVEVARIALPIWLYVAITGLVIYALLYVRSS